MTKEWSVSLLAVRVQEKGQVTIPLEIRRKLNLKKGDLVTFVETEDGVLIRPAELIASQVFDQIGKALQEKGLKLDDLIERVREKRGEVVEKEYNLFDTPPK